jgi:hypothetical protein
MAQTFEKIPDELIPWIEAQPVFFVATAPADQATHLNVSPRGLDTFSSGSWTRTASPGSISPAVAWKR